MSTIRLCGVITFLAFAGWLVCAVFSFRFRDLQQQLGTFHDVLSVRDPQKRTPDGVRYRVGTACAADPYMYNELLKFAVELRYSVAFIQSSGGLRCLETRWHPTDGPERVQ